MNPTSSTKEGNFYVTCPDYGKTWNFTLDSSDNANKFFEALEKKKTINLSLTAKIEGGTQYFYAGSLSTNFFGFVSTSSDEFEGKYFIYAENDGEKEQFGIILQTTDVGLKKHKIGQIVEGTN